jgi:hypothetical protein
VTPHATAGALKIFLACVCLGMTALAVKTSFESNLFEVFGSLAAEPWVVATLVDFYFNIALISLWVAYKETKAKAALWIASFVFLGSITTSLYILVQVLQWKTGDPLDSILLRRPRA